MEIVFPSEYSCYYDYSGSLSMQPDDLKGYFFLEYSRNLVRALSTIDSSACVHATTSMYGIVFVVFPSD